MSEGIACQSERVDRLLSIYTVDRAGASLIEAMETWIKGGGGGWGLEM